MLLYIVRHAYAGQHGDPRYPDDSLRPLTKKGRKEFSRAMKKLARRGFAPKLVATSPLVRCRQTADAIRKRVDPKPELVELSSLQPGSDLDALLSWSNERAVDQLAWVGHAPDVGFIATLLIGQEDGWMNFKKGAIAAIRSSDSPDFGRGELQWFLTAKVLGL